MHPQQVFNRPMNEMELIIKRKKCLLYISMISANGAEGGHLYGFPKSNHRADSLSKQRPGLSCPLK